MFILVHKRGTYLNHHNAVGQARVRPATKPSNSLQYIIAEEQENADLIGQQSAMPPSVVDPSLSVGVVDEKM